MDPNEFSEFSDMRHPIIAQRDQIKINPTTRLGSAYARCSLKSQNNPGSFG